MEYININKLKPHPKNNFFFDDIKGEPWADFVDSIKWSKGPVDPIVITPDFTIVSGHQRVRACKQLDIKEVKCTTQHFLDADGNESEDEVLRALIETNIRQRGIGNPNPVKFGRCLLELERIYGIKNGGDHGNQYTGGSFPQGETGKTREELLKELGISSSAYDRYKKLAQLPEDIQKAVCDGVINQTVASRVIARLSPEDQEKLVNKIIEEEGITTKQIDEYVKQIKASKNENDKLRKIISENETQNASEKMKLKSKNDELQDEIENLKNNPVKPKDYDDLKKKASDVDKYKNFFEKEQEKVEKERKEKLELQKKIDALKSQGTQSSEYIRLVEAASYFTLKCNSFIRDMDDYAWIIVKYNDFPKEEKEKISKAVDNIVSWASFTSCKK